MFHDFVTKTSAEAETKGHKTRRNLMLISLVTSHGPLTFREGYFIFGVKLASLCPTSDIQFVCDLAGKPPKNEPVQIRTTGTHGGGTGENAVLQFSIKLSSDLIGKC